MRPIIGVKYMYTRQLINEVEDQVLYQTLINTMTRTRVPIGLVVDDIHTQTWFNMRNHDWSVMMLEEK